MFSSQKSGTRASAEDSSICSFGRCFLHMPLPCCNPAGGLVLIKVVCATGRFLFQICLGCNNFAGGHVFRQPVFTTVSLLPFRTGQHGDSRGLQYQQDVLYSCCLRISSLHPLPDMSNLAGGQVPRQPQFPVPTGATGILSALESLARHKSFRAEIGECLEQCVSGRITSRDVKAVLHKYRSEKVRP